MRKWIIGSRGLLAAVIIMFSAGCGRETVNIPDTTPPQVVSTTPAQGATGVGLTATVNASFSKPMNATTINATTFTVTGLGGVAVAGTVTYAATGSIATFTPTVNFVPSTLYTATITTGVRDQASPANALAARYVWTFTTGLAPDTTRPTVALTLPANGATVVPINQVISATFSEALNPTTVNGTTFTLTAPGGVAVAGTVTYTTAGSIARFTPNVNLAFGTIYTATITTGVTDLAANALAANYVWTFTTAPPPDTIPPTVVATTPINGTTGVPLAQVLTATFSEAMDCTTLKSPATTFTLSGPGATAVAGTVNCVGAVATFTPSALLAANTLFTAIVTTGARDLAGNALAANYAWSFRTTPATGPPTVIFTTPINGATSVPINQSLSATFSVAMNPATINATTFTVTGPGGVAVAGVVA